MASIRASFAFIWTIRLQSQANKISGDAALRHADKRNKTIAIGRSQLPEYWTKNQYAKDS